METVEVAITGSYQEVGLKGLWGVVQNIGNADVDVVLGTVLPADTVKGFILKPIDIINIGAFGDENVYIKSRTGSGVIIILK